MSGRSDIVQTLLDRGANFEAVSEVTNYIISSYQKIMNIILYYIVQPHTDMVWCFIWL